MIQGHVKCPIKSLHFCSKGLQASQGTKCLRTEWHFSIKLSFIDNSVRCDAVHTFSMNCCIGWCNTWRTKTKFNTIFPPSSLNRARPSAQLSSQGCPGKNGRRGFNEYHFEVLGEKQAVYRVSCIENSLLSLLSVLIQFKEREVDQVVRCRLRKDSTPLMKII